MYQSKAGLSWHLISLSNRALASTLIKRLTRGIDRFMDTTYSGFLTKRIIYANTSETYREVSEYFPRDEINALFRKEVEKLLAANEHISPELQREVEMLRERDWVAYLDRSLRRSGFKDPDLDLMVQDLCVKLLITGNLFSGWRGGSSFQARFLVTLRNAIATLVKKQQTARRRSHELPPDAPSRAAHDTNTLVDNFREFLRKQLGAVAVSVFDQRLEGEDTKELIGQQGIETSYRLKRIVADIKTAARNFASRYPEFFNMVQKAFADEAKTMEKRFGRVRA